jgi:hypothetical protein
MATLPEYFDTDFPSVLNAASTLTISQGGSATTFEVRGRVHYDFDSGTKYRNSKKLLYKRITAQEESDSTMKGLGFLERKT